MRPVEKHQGCWTYIWCILVGGDSLLTVPPAVHLMNIKIMHLAKQTWFIKVLTFDLLLIFSQLLSKKTVYILQKAP